MMTIMMMRRGYSLWYAALLGRPPGLPRWICLLRLKAYFDQLANYRYSTFEFTAIS